VEEKRIFCYIIKNRRIGDLINNIFKMKHMGFNVHLRYIVLSILLFGFSVNPQAEAAFECGVGKRPLFYYADTLVTNAMPKGFAGRLFNMLEEPLNEVGYCLTRLTRSYLADTSLQDELIMAFSMQYSVTEHPINQADLPDGDGNDSQIKEETAQYDSTARMVVSLLRVDSWSSRELRLAQETPLLTLVYNPEELAIFESVLIRKIVENLRTQYICHLRILSEPDGVLIRSRGGLEGTTPLEWIIPVGKLSISGELKGFEPIRRRLDLGSPGMHTYVIELRKRRFYRSKIFIPTVVMGGSSAALFVASRVIYAQYESLDKVDRDADPDLFRRKFTQAKNLERSSGVALGLAAVSFALCFVF